MKFPHSKILHGIIVVMVLIERPTPVAQITDSAFKNMFHFKNILQTVVGVKTDPRTSTIHVIAS